MLESETDSLSLATLTASLQGSMNELQTETGDHRIHI
jgi:hypothetical protein